MIPPILTARRIAAPLALIFCASVISACTRDQRLELRPVDSKASFRGLSVVDDDVAWVSGSSGTVARTTDGGLTWAVVSPFGYDSIGIRSIYAFDAQSAVIGTAGYPAHILRTDDGGDTWELVYTNTDSAAFIDGVDFWDTDRGIMYGDPIDGLMLLIRTTDGGRTWSDLPIENRPELEPGEYSFAASGTGIRCYGSERLVISTGGSVARLWMSEDAGLTWTAHATPMMQGEASTGIFSVAFLNGEYAVIVGGDYRRDTLATDHVYLSRDGGSDWIAPERPTRGYRECVEVLSGNTLVATGPTGSDISYDGGEHWDPMSDEKGLHVVRKARVGSLVVLAGNEGKVFVLR